VHTLQQPRPSPGHASSLPVKQCVVYSLAYHHKKACLLTVGSLGSVAIWKAEGWDREGSSDDGDDEGAEPEN